MITVIYSFNKQGYEADFWSREIAAASDHRTRFVPFNHDPYLPPQRYTRAQLLDNLYYARDASIEKLYANIRQVILEENADGLIVDTCAPYHPEFLKSLDVYKVLRTSDGPMSSYDRDFAYLHAYDLVLYHSPAYSRDMTMIEKLRYCRADRCELWPLGVFDAAFDPEMPEETLFSRERDIDIVFVGALHPNKMELLAKVKRSFGKRFVLHGLSSVKRNIYFNAKFGLPGWVQPLGFENYVPLYQRAKIGINIHNRGKYTVGGFRLFELPANGVMQISDGGEYLDTFFEPGREIVGYENADELIDKLRYFLEHDDERTSIARSGYHRAMRDHRIVDRLKEAGRLIAEGILSDGRRGKSRHLADE